MKKRRNWEKVDLSEYSNPENNNSNEIDLNEVELDDINKRNDLKNNLKNFYSDEEDDNFDKELESLAKEDRDWYSGVSEEEKIMRALENGYGDLYGFD